jgi:hypothetical protein
MNFYPITIVDNFYENPDEVRQLALSQQYYPASELDNSEGIFPGKRTHELGSIDSDFFATRWTSSLVYFMITVLKL